MDTTKKSLGFSKRIAELNQIKEENAIGSKARNLYIESMLLARRTETIAKHLKLTHSISLRTLKAYEQGQKSLTDYKRSEIESKRITLKRDNHLLDLSQKQESFRIFLGLNPKDNLKLKSNFF